CVGRDREADGHTVAAGETPFSCGDHRPFADAAQLVTGMRVFVTETTTRARKYTMSVDTAPADHDHRRLAEPSTGRRARDAEIRRDRDVSGALDEIPKPVIVALLMPSRRRHGDNH